MAVAGAIVAVAPGMAGAQEAQQPAQPQPAQQSQPSSVFTFNSDAGFFSLNVKGDKTADFETLMNRVKEALAKSEDPVRKQQAAGWRVFKVADATQTGNVIYVFFMHPVVKDADYTPLKILYEAFQAEGQDLLAKWKDSLAQGGSKLNLQLVADFGK
jgi:hypothetical protein